VREIVLSPGAIRAEGEGINEIRDRIPVLTRIDVRYSLTVPPDVREKVDRALATHVAKCPTAQTLKGAVEIRWTADIQEPSAG
jgi:uncharacterized OsmC-like protein